MIRRRDRPKDVHLNQLRLAMFAMNTCGKGKQVDQGLLCYYNYRVAKWSSRNAPKEYLHKWHGYPKPEPLGPCEYMAIFHWNTKTKKTEKWEDARVNNIYLGTPRELERWYSKIRRGSFALVKCYGAFYKGVALVDYIKNPIKKTVWVRALKRKAQRLKSRKR